MSGIVTEASGPEHVMVRRAGALGLAAGPVAFAAGALAGGADGGWSALLGVVLVVANFAVHGLSLAWAAGISIPMLQVVALGGFVARMAVIVGVLVLLNRTAFFSPAFFGVAAVITVFALLGYEARLMSRGLGGGLQIPPEPSAAAAAAALRAREDGR
jgi:hypothetical protein